MIDPMLAQRADNAFDSKDWLYELKLDGARCVALLSDQTVLQGRSGNILTRKFPELLDIHRQVGKPCILDGEIVGKDFAALARRVHKENPFDIRIARRENPVCFVVFDVLEVDGEPVAKIPLHTRKEVLNTLDLDFWEEGELGNPVSQLKYRIGDGVSFFDEVKEKQLEGIMAKYLQSPYHFAKRSEAWLKIKNLKMASLYVCGLTAGENARKHLFGALILGEEVDGKLVYRGNVGTGFTNRQLEWMLEFFRKLEGPPVFQASVVGKPVKFWVKPVVKCEVEYFELGVGGLIRFPTFRKLESDYAPMQRLV